MSFALQKCCIKEQNEQILLWDFEYGLVSDKISEVFVDFFDDLLWRF